MPIYPGSLLPEQDDIIFVVEMDEVIRSALHFILDDQYETHSFADLDLALSKAVRIRPTVLLLGIGHLQGDGERVLAKITARVPGAKILIVADRPGEPLVLASLQWGAHGVLGKPITFDSVRCKVDGLRESHAFPLDLLALLPPSAAW
jgi:DNA-binding response OmpR family regulator